MVRVATSCGSRGSVISATSKVRSGSLGVADDVTPVARSPLPAPLRPPWASVICRRFEVGMRVEDRRRVGTLKAKQPKRLAGAGHHVRHQLVVSGEGTGDFEAQLFRQELGHVQFDGFLETGGRVQPADLPKGDEPEHLALSARFGHGRQAANADGGISFSQK